MPETNRPAYQQDPFDRAFIKVLHAVQKHGRCKSVSQLEEHLKIPPRTLHQVLAGNRGVPKLHRHKLQQHFVNNYDVSAQVFVNPQKEIFRHDPPELAEDEVLYGVQRNILTYGDFAQFERLQQENADLKQQLEEMKKEVKYWRELAQDTFTVVRETAQKYGHKPEQKGAKKWKVYV